MPELPDVDVYIEHIAARTMGHTLERVRLASPFVLRTADPSISVASGRTVTRVSRLGKRIVFDLSAKEGEPLLHLVIHLMVAGRFKWKPLGTGVPGKIGLAAFDFAAAPGGAPKQTTKTRAKTAATAAWSPEAGTLILTEASSKKRASIHLVRPAGLTALDPGGIEVFGTPIAELAARLRSENHTLKRAMTDPHLFSGIGNAYSDEILHHAQMSPVKLTSRLTDAEIEKLFTSTRHVLTEWTDRLRSEAGEFPEGVTAFRPEMVVHGKYGKPCPRCSKPVQRIRYADNEMNYCTCQTDGKLLADRSLSRLMRGDWPKTLEELEAKKTLHRSLPPGPPSAPHPAAEPAAPKKTAAAAKKEPAKKATPKKKATATAGGPKPRS